MNTTIKTKNGTERINTEEIMSKGVVYASLVAYFNNFINNNATKELQDMYFGSFEEFEGGSYLTWRGAIEDMYNTLCEYIEENNINFMTTRDYWKIDFDGVIQY